MKRAEPSFGVGEFLSGARGAYEMILMGFDNGEIEDLKPFLSDEIYETFSEVIEQRAQQGLTIEAQFVGVRELSLVDATFDDTERLAEITVKYVGELTSVVKNAAGEVIEGSPTAVKRQKDVWTYARRMGSDDPNWQLVATRCGNCTRLMVRKVPSSPLVAVNMPAAAKAPAARPLPPASAAFQPFDKATCPASGTFFIPAEQISR